MLVHFATLLAVFTYFYRDFLRMFRSLLSAVKGGFSVPHYRRLYAGRRRPSDRVWYIVIGTIPAALAGVHLKDRIETLFTDPYSAALFLVVDGRNPAFDAVCPDNGKRQ